MAHTQEKAKLHHWQELQAGDAAAVTEIVHGCLSEILAEADKRAFKKPFRITVTDNDRDAVVYHMQPNGDVQQTGGMLEWLLTFPLELALQDAKGRRIQATLGNLEQTANAPS